MLRTILTAMIVLASFACWQDPTAPAQQVQITSPLQTINDSFYENFGFGGINMGRSGPRGGWYLNTGPATSTPPPFGGHDPGADARFGMRFGGSPGFGFDMVAGQGSTRTNTVTAPTIVVPHGGTGSLFSGSVRPFVTGVIPVVGHAPIGPLMPLPPQSSVSPLAQRVAQLQQQPGPSRAAAAGDRDPAAVPLAGRDEPALVLRPGLAEADADAGPAAGRSSGAAASTANHGDFSVAEIRRQQAAEDAARLEEIQVRIEKARGCEEDGKPGLAKIYYQQAAARADGELKQQLLDKIRRLDEAN